MKESWRRTCAELRRCGSLGGRQELGATVAEGYRLVERALRAGAELRRAMVARNLLEQPPERARRLIAELEKSGVPIDVAPDEVLGELTEGRDLGHIAALVTLPPQASLESLADGDGTLLVACGVRDPGNLGAIARTCLALGARALVAVDSSDVFHPRALRTSLGSLFKLPVVQRPGPGRGDSNDAALALLNELSSLGMRSVGAVSQSGQDPREGLGGTRVAVWMGSEALGLDATLAERLHARVTIPMAAGVDSLSVHVAAAVLLYERRATQ